MEGGTEKRCWLRLDELEGRITYLDMRMKHAATMENGEARNATIAELVAQLRRAETQFTALNKQMTEGRALYVALQEDITEATSQYVQAQDSPFARRTFIRSLFSLIEGLIFSNKQLALVMHKAELVNFSPAEVVLLQEEQYVLSDSGKAKTQPLFLNLFSNVRFSFEALARAGGSNYKLDCGGRGWNAFRKAVECRNRITHPKSADDLNITDDEMAAIREAASWYLDCQGELQRSLMDET